MDGSTKLVALLLQNSLKLPARAGFEKYETRFRQGLDNYKTYIRVEITCNSALPEV